MPYLGVLGSSSEKLLSYLKFEFVLLQSLVQK